MILISTFLLINFNCQFIICVNYDFFFLIIMTALVSTFVKYWFEYKETNENWHLRLRETFM